MAFHNNAWIDLSSFAIEPRERESQDKKKRMLHTNRDGRARAQTTYIKCIYDECHHSASNGQFDSICCHWLQLNSCKHVICIHYVFYLTHTLCQFICSECVVHVVTCNNKIQQWIECKYVKWDIQSQCMAKFNDTLNEQANGPCTPKETDIHVVYLKLYHFGHVWLSVYKYRKMQQCRLYTRIDDYIIFYRKHIYLFNQLLTISFNISNILSRTLSAIVAVLTVQCTLYCVHHLSFLRI